MINKYKVLGEGEVDILGEQRAAGSEVELEAEAASPLVEEGKLELVSEGAGE